MNVWQMTLVSVAVISLVSLVGLGFISLGERFTQKVILVAVAFAVGALLGDAFIHILPEVYEGAVVEVHEHGHEEVGEEHSHGEVLPAVLVVGGVLVFFGVEKVLRWRHCHHLPDDCEHAHPVAVMNLIGDGMHNFLDGVLVAGSFLVSVPVGVATAVAVVLHEVPQEIGDFATLRHAGFSWQRAVFWNFLIACTAFLGAILVLVWSPDLAVLQGVLLPLTAGGFIYIAGSDLIPMLHEKTNPWMGVAQMVAMAAGVAVMWGITGLE